MEEVASWLGLKLATVFSRAGRVHPGSSLSWVLRSVNRHCPGTIAGSGTRLGTGKVEGKKHLKARRDQGV